MPDPITKPELVAALTAATGGSEFLDHLILRHLGQPARYDDEGQFGAYRILPTTQRFTRVEAAALSLVPPDWFISLRRFSDGWYAMVKPRSVDAEEHGGEQKLLALAICIAAIKAMPRQGQRMKVTQYRPAFVSGFENEVHEVDSVEAMLALPFVAGFTELVPGEGAKFHRFSLAEHRLMAEYDEGRRWFVVAMLDDPAGIAATLPTWKRKCR